VADTNNSRIQKFSSDGVFVRQWSTPTPVGVTVDSGGDVYVTDFQNHCVRKFDGDGGSIGTWGSPGDAENQFNGPWGIAGTSPPTMSCGRHINYRVRNLTAMAFFVRMWGEYGTETASSIIRRRGVDAEATSTWSKIPFAASRILHRRRF
jgi:DNA-binding beta-propeller fold protein YncE